MARERIVRRLTRVIGGFEIVIEQTEAYQRRGQFTSEPVTRYVDAEVFLQADGTPRGKAQVRNALKAWLDAEQEVDSLIRGEKL